MKCQELAGNMINKICINCYKLKELSLFVKNENCCKKCKKEYKKKYFIKNKEKIIKYKKKYYNINYNKINEINKEYYNKNKNILSVNRRLYRENNIESLLLRKAKERAFKFNLDFNITLNDIKNVMTNICPLLEIPMVINKNHVKYNSFTLDRIIPEKGYIKNNILVISHKANRSKNNATINEYEKIILNFKKNIIISNKEKYITPFLQEIIDHAKQRSKIKNIEFNLDKEYLNNIYPFNNKCSLLEIVLEKGKNKCKYNSPTLDRINPKLGYIKDNVSFVSHKANTIKNSLTLDEMKLLIKNLKNIGDIC